MGSLDKKQIVSLEDNTSIYATMIGHCARVEEHHVDSDEDSSQMARKIQARGGRGGGSREARRDEVLVLGRRRTVQRDRTTRRRIARVQEESQPEKGATKAPQVGRE